MNKNLKKVSSAATVPCKFRGTGIECPRFDFVDGKCGTCGWNPDVEDKRKAVIVNERSRDQHL